MSILLSLVSQILHIGLMIVAAPTAAGLIDWLGAKLTGRAGPPVLSSWHDLVRWSRKTPIQYQTASIAARLGPVIGLGATLSAAALVPSFTLGMVLSPIADVLVVVSLLTIARVAIVLAALDSGAALPAVAAQHLSAVAILAEPALLLSVIALGMMGGSFNLDQLIIQQHDGLLSPAAACAVVLAALLALGFADTAMPAQGFDQMFGGVQLAMSRMTGWLRRLIWCDFLGGLFLPVGIATTEWRPWDWLLGLLCWAIKLAGFILLLAIVQTRPARTPHRSLPDLVGIAALLALLAIVIVMAGA